MNTRCALLWTVVALIGVCPLSAIAEESSWKLPNLNPFAAKDKPPTAGRVSGSKSAGWRMPRLWPGNSTARKPSNQPSTMQKMTTGTKQFFSKTADALNPWDDENDDRIGRASGSNSAFSRATTKKKKPEESRGSLIPASWWGGEEKDGRAKDVNEFLSQPRPSY